MRGAPRGRRGAISSTTDRGLLTAASLKRPGARVSPGRARSVGTWSGLGSGPMGTERAVIVRAGEGHRVSNVEFLARSGDTPRFNPASITIQPHSGGPGARPFSRAGFLCWARTRSPVSWSSGRTPAMPWTTRWAMARAWRGWRSPAAMTIRPTPPTAAWMPRALWHPLRALRDRLPHPLPHRRRAEGDRHAAGAAARASRRAPEGHVAARHRRAARPAGRPHQDEDLEDPADRLPREHLPDAVRREDRDAYSRSSSAMLGIDALGYEAVPEGALSRGAGAARTA